MSHRASNSFELLLVPLLSINFTACRSMMKRAENIAMATDRNRDLELENLLWERTLATP